MAKPKDETTSIRKIIREIDSGLTHMQGDALASKILETMTQKLMEGKRVSFTNIGTIQLTPRKGRTYTNPTTGKRFDKPATRRLTAYTAKQLKDLVESS